MLGRPPCHGPSPERTYPPLPCLAPHPTLPILPGDGPAAGGELVLELELGLGLGLELELELELEPELELGSAALVLRLFGSPLSSSSWMPLRFIAS